MSFLKKLFGGNGAKASGGKAAAPIVHKGYEIVARPQADGSQFRLAGTISKEVDGIVKEHMLIRADVFPSLDEAVSATQAKAKRLIDEQGEMIFR